MAVGVEGVKGSKVKGLGSRNKEDKTNGHDSGNHAPGNIHENEMDSGLGLNTGSIFPFQGKESLTKPTTQNEVGDDLKWEKGIQQKEETQFNFILAPRLKSPRGDESPVKNEEGNGPMAMCFNEDSGWVAETLGSKSGHWKRLVRMAQSKEESMGLDQLGSKRIGPVPT